MYRNLIEKFMKPAKAFLLILIFLGLSLVGFPVQAKLTRTLVFTQVLDTNPLIEIRNTQQINAVVVNGRLLNPQMLDRMLGGIESAAKENDRFKHRC
jgi:hypothetical protein